MTQFITDNKDILLVIIPISGILLTLAFGGILNWRQKICLDYESRRDVAINILRDRFVQRTSTHYSNIAKEQKRHNTEVEEIYKRPEQQILIRELARDLEDQNRIRFLFGGLTFTSQMSFGCIWLSIISIIIGVILIFLKVRPIFLSIWLIFFVIFLIGFIGFVSAMWFFDGRFFKLVHRIIEPEGE